MILALNFSLHIKISTSWQRLLYSGCTVGQSGAVCQGCCHPTQQEISFKMFKNGKINYCMCTVLQYKQVTVSCNALCIDCWSCQMFRCKLEVLMYVNYWTPVPNPSASRFCAVPLPTTSFVAYSQAWTGEPEFSNSGHRLLLYGKSNHLSINMVALDDVVLHDEKICSSV